MDSSANSNTLLSAEDGANKFSDNVAISALAVSLVALLFVILQLSQAIVAAAKGLPNCGKSVIGLWADPKHNIRLRWFLRLEVRYESPVIFLAHSSNKFGPVGHDDKVKIWYADGSKTSCKNTRTVEPEAISEEENNIAKSQGYIPEGVHTVDNELATWVTLLGAIQKMERDSKDWEALKWRMTSPPQPTLPDEITLAVGIQSVKRSFESHPDIKRPYATTTICHIVELAAVLGIYWKEFNRDKNSYHAEGNGYNLLGTRLNNFGIVFIFERTGRPKFRETRVIPTCEVKELCFGNVPTFYRTRDRKDEAGWGLPFNEQKTLQTLQLGSRKEIVETLNLIGCNTRTSLFYLQERKQHIHLFPVLFEIIGMLGRTMHIKDRCFTYLPNPTIFPWNRRSFSLRRLLKAFCKHLSEGISSVSEVPEALQLVNAQAELLSRELDLDRELPLDQDSDYGPPQLNQLHKALDVVDGILDENKIPKKIVLDVLRRHLQVVLSAINTTARREEAWGLASMPNSPASPRARVGPVPGAESGSGEDSAPPTSNNDPIDISFDDLLGIPRENREAEFMKKYFEEIRVQVISTDSSFHPDPQAAEASRALHEAGQESQMQNHDQSHSQTQNVATPPPPSSQATPTDLPPSPPPITTHSRSSTFGFPGRTSTSFTFPGRVGTNHSSTKAETWGLAFRGGIFEPQRNSIWCALVFRMLCWLLLHDFDKKDVQLPKSQLLGSRQSVYIM